MMIGTTAAANKMTTTAGGAKIVQVTDLRGATGGHHSTMQADARSGPANDHSWKETRYGQRPFVRKRSL